MRVLALIPARGGSKGIPRKNLVDLSGRPLIAWSIETARELVRRGCVARAIVSTDDEEIAGTARAHGAEVPFLRPAELATDTAKSIGFVLHALDALEAEGERYDAVLLLQPTAPVRDVDAIEAAIMRFDREGAVSLISCYREEYVNALVMYDDAGDGRLRPRHPDHNTGVRRQEHGPTWVRNGAVYLTRVDFIREEGKLVSDGPLLLPMSKADSVDLDTPEDLAILRAMLCARAS
ncbi:MAG: acylneuraminate cytidylyltransferase family protein [Salinarimonadaceae bacterium]|nr:MAG: acylneuraminate cytidylyltransferase family protein [Salinarimonadaceae bacterium]